MFTLRDYQLEAVEHTFEYLSEMKGNPCICLATGCHSKGTLVLKYSGDLIPIEDVRVGDILMGPDSSPRWVRRLCRGIGKMYKISPKRGPSFVVNGDHILRLKSTNQGKRVKKANPFVEISVNEYLSKNKNFKHLYKLYRVGVDFPKIAPPDICPWFAGVVIGDGSTLLDRNATITTPDQEVIDGVVENVCKMGGYVSFIKKQGTSCLTLSICDEKASRTKLNRVKEALINNGLWGKMAGDKFVPRKFKLGSREVRLNVLAGLLDTDGHLSKGTGFDFISKSKQLSEDVVFISRSLGLSAKMSPCIKGCQNGFKGEYFRVSISGDTDIIPLRITRKRASARGQKKSPLVSGFTIEELSEDSFYGFELDGDHLYLTSDFVVHHNSGKSLVLAELIRRIPKDKGILLLSHRAKILTQNIAKIESLLPLEPIGIYSASLKEKRIRRVTVAQVQSLYRQVDKLDYEFHYILIDENHLVSSKDEGMYQKIIKKFPKARVIGLTATPKRLDSGSIVGEGKTFTHFSYMSDIRQLIDDGYLTPLIGKVGVEQADLSEVKLQGSEYILSQAMQAINKDYLTRSATEECIKYGRDRKHWIVFCSGVEHAENVSKAFNDKGITNRVITGDTIEMERNLYFNEFESGQVRALINVDVLTTGFDAPCIDMIVMLRATKSVSLYSQILGRGMRLFPGKKDCLVLDFAHNLEEHGPIDEINYKASKQRERGERSEDDIRTVPAKICEKCLTLNATAARVCTECEFPFPERIVTHSAVASSASPLSMKATAPAQYDVTDIDFIANKSKKTGKPMLIVNYYSDILRFSEFLFFDHEGFARDKSVAWWKKNTISLSVGLPIPENTEEALVRIDREMFMPEEIWAKKDKDGYDKVLSIKLTSEMVRKWKENKVKKMEEDIPF